MTYKVNDNFIVSDVAGEKVLVPIADSVADMGSMLVLNETSEFIFAKLVTPSSVDDIVAAFLEEYECPEEQQVRADVTDFIAQMVAKGFIIQC